MGNNRWRFSASTLSWPASTAGYTQYTGGIASNLYSNGWTSGISLGAGFTFEWAISTTASVGSGSVRFTTNGQIFVGVTGQVDLNNDKPNLPPATSRPFYYCNAGGPLGTNQVNILQPGAPLSDGDTQGIWSLFGSSGRKWYAKFIVFSGLDGNPVGISSYILNLYKDDSYQWMETRTKTTPNSTFAGPWHPTVDVSQPASATSQVWVAGGASTTRFDNWTYMGTGSVVS
jgi:hypothetical protein